MESHPSGARGGRFATVSQPFFFFSSFSPNGGGWKRITAIKNGKGGKEGRGGRRIGEDGSEPSQAPGAFDASHYGNATSRGS